jgi:predicted enzyme related to lactoylglutathione lyase
VKFYESILNIELGVMDCGETEKMAFFPGANNVCQGAISFAKDFRPSKDGVLIHLHVESMEKTISAIEKSDGKVVHPKTKIEAENTGYFALFIDSEGNKVGLYSDK